jgi:hypothetical protein
MILGTIEHLVIRRVLLGKPERLVPFTDQFWRMIIQGIVLPKEEKVFTVRISAEPEEVADKGGQPIEKKRRSPGEKKV